MVAFGLAVLALLVLLPGLGHVPRGAGYGAGARADRRGRREPRPDRRRGDQPRSPTGGSTDYLAYATGSRLGVLLTSRLILG